MIENIDSIEYEIEHPKGTPLKYSKFKKYEIPPHFKGQWIFRFKNNYGASVVKKFGSYGYDRDLFELAIIKFFDKTNNFVITYETSISNSVIGYLSNEDVLDYLSKIKKLEV